MEDLSVTLNLLLAENSILTYKFWFLVLSCTEKASEMGFRWLLNGN